MAAIVSLCWWMTLPLAVVGSLLHFLYDLTGEKRWPCRTCLAVGA